MRRVFPVVTIVTLLAWPLPAASQATPAGSQTAPAEGRGAGGGFRGRGGPPRPANQPAPRDDARHKSFVERAQAGNIDLLFVGDSITDWWARAGLEVWKANFEPLNAANFGIAGDTTQGVLWRMQNGELDGFTARLIVHMLGTNNINRNPVDEIVDGNRLILEEFKRRQPQARILLLGVFPRRPAPDDPIRATIAELNGKLAALADNRQVFFKDIGGAFLAPDGTLPTDVMPDGLHPSAKGYQIWADAIRDDVKRLLNEGRP
jgi:lysophospholipase L1-like esterase